MRLAHVLVPFVSVATLASGTLAQLVINTPYARHYQLLVHSFINVCHIYSTNVVVCQPVLLTWSGGEGKLTNIP